MRDTRFFSAARARRPRPLDRPRSAAPRPGRLRHEGVRADRGDEVPRRSRHRRARPRVIQNRNVAPVAVPGRDRGEDGADVRCGVLRRSRSAERGRPAARQRSSWTAHGRALLRRGHAARTTGSTDSRERTVRRTRGSRVGDVRDPGGNRPGRGRRRHLGRSCRRRDLDAIRADSSSPTRRPPIRPRSGERIGTLAITSPGVTYRQRARCSPRRSSCRPRPTAGPWWARAASAVGGAVVDVVGGLASDRPDRKPGRRSRASDGRLLGSRDHDGGRERPVRTRGRPPPGGGARPHDHRGLRGARARARHGAQGRRDVPRGPDPCDRPARRAAFHGDQPVRRRGGVDRARPDPARRRGGPRPGATCSWSRTSSTPGSPSATCCSASCAPAGPRRLEVCTLLDKSARRIVPLAPRYVGLRLSGPVRRRVRARLAEERYRNLADILAGATISRR